jgi:WD40 repeat protein/tRNA A-37 threonylcarbamoyl transferase component Bud32
MTETLKRRCSRCGAALPSGAFGGNCLACLLQLGMAAKAPDPPSEALDAPGPQQTSNVEDLAAEIALGTKIGRYTLVQKIGEGGCGVVYMAQQEEPVRRRVALKIIKLGMDTRQVIARFEAERQALAMMDHANIAKVFDTGATQTGRPYFVMELVCGAKITEFCDKNHLPTGDRLTLFAQVCRAVQHAHQKGVIHRDLKPSNILVTMTDGVPTPKIIDFGIAKATQGKLTDQTFFTAFEQFLGTPAYMSPEQAQMSTADVDTRSDIYSLGVLLYELLTGNTPFDAKELLQAGLDEMRRTIREKDPARPSHRLKSMGLADLTVVAQQRQTEPPKLLGGVRGDLDWIVMKCLEKDRAQRYETVNGLATDLWRYLRNEPVLARPPSDLYRLQKLVRRNQVVVAACSLAAAALLTGAGLATWQAIRATRERVGAETAWAMEAKQRVKAESLVYAADMAKIQQSWEQDELDTVCELLAETASYPGRGFEWYYWEQQMRSQLATLRGHNGPIRAVAFFPDGRKIVTASEDHTAKVWEATSGKELLNLAGHSDFVFCVAVSPDGERIVTGSRDRTAKVWDAASGDRLLSFNKHPTPVYSVAISPDSRRVVTGAYDGTALIWDLTSGAILFSLDGGHRPITSVAYSPDGQKLVTANNDGTATMWDATTGEKLRTFQGRVSSLLSIAFSPDGTRVAAVGDIGTELWETATAKEMLFFKGHRALINSVAFTPDGQRIVTGSNDRLTKVWEASSGMELFTLRGHLEGVTCLALSPDGQRIVTGSADWTAMVWDATGARQLRLLRGPRVSAVAFSPDGQRVATGCSDGTARLYDPDNGRELRTLQWHNGGVSAIAFSPDGRRIVSGAAVEGATTVWNIRGGEPPLRLGGFQRCRVATFSPDGKRILTCGERGKVRVWDSVTGNQLLTISGERNSFLVAALSPNGQQIATGDLGGGAQVWDASTGRRQLLLNGHGDAVDGIAFSPDGQQIATASADATAIIWDAVNGHKLMDLKAHRGWVTCLAFSPDGHRVATGGGDGTIRLWDTSNGKELLRLARPDGMVNSVAFSPDGKRILAGYWEQVATIWQAASVEQAATWQREEAVEVQRRAALQREKAAASEEDRVARAGDPGAIKEWLVLAPIAYSGNNSVKANQQQQIAGETNLRPRAGQLVTVGGKQLGWRALQLKDDLIDFNDFLGETTEWSVAYAVCYVRSDADQRGLHLRVGTDDEARLYLNGQEVYRCEEVRHYTPDQDLVENVELKAGLNVLVLKVVNETNTWQASVRFTDPAGHPVKGSRVSLTSSL